VRGSTLWAGHIEGREKLPIIPERLGLLGKVEFTILDVLGHQSGRLSEYGICYYSSSDIRSRFRGLGKPYRISKKHVDSFHSLDICKWTMIPCQKVFAQQWASEWTCEID